MSPSLRRHRALKASVSLTASALTRAATHPIDAMVASKLWLSAARRDLTRVYLSVMEWDIESAQFAAHDSERAQDQ